MKIRQHWRTAKTKINFKTSFSSGVAHVVNRRHVLLKPYNLSSDIVFREQQTRNIDQLKMWKRTCRCIVFVDWIYCFVPFSLPSPTWLLKRSLVPLKVLRPQSHFTYSDSRLRSVRLFFNILFQVPSSLKGPPSAVSFYVFRLSVEIC